MHACSEAWASGRPNRQGQHSADLEQAVVQVQANHPAGWVDDPNLATVTGPPHLVLDVTVRARDKLACAS